ncbi:hypothetical protein [Clostridium omnivorum]|uniref:Uncharacterized protein n=1 Tax=Clostridium omnivorum TaxID=1604902 RepID=A0ABQ5NA11_9CLOT|nr:hypothetical protein [Clostridium sp. E14]GLC32011.1 hypothetical protein bsdE14_34210 [Clostridium sp. E14]
MKKDKATIKLSATLLSISFILYLLNYIIFKDIVHIAEFLAQYIAFIPIEALVTVVIIGSLLENRDKIKKQQKINILIQVFFEEVGNELLCKLEPSEKKCCELGCLRWEFNDLLIKDTKNIRNEIEKHNVILELKSEDINSLYELLNSNKDTFIKFLENPYLTEHDTFTDLIQSISHLYYEISFRRSRGEYSEADMIHIREDAQRVYKNLLEKWLIYMEYTQKEYPFLFDLALQNAPFNDMEKLNKHI